MTSNRLTDTETSSESSAKRATLLNDEVESLRAQLRTLKAEMEEQERSLKSQVCTVLIYIQSISFKVITCCKFYALNQILITFFLHIVRFLPTERQPRAEAARILGDGATGVAEVGGGAVRATGNGT